MKHSAAVAETRHGQWHWLAADAVKRIPLLIPVFLIMLAMAGCHTVKGVGQDINSAGKAIERSSGK